MWAFTRPACLPILVGSVRAMVRQGEMRCNDYIPRFRVAGLG